MINVDIFDEKMESYICGNIGDTKKWLKKLSRRDRATVVNWCHVENPDVAHRWALWIIEGL